MSTGPAGARLVYGLVAVLAATGLAYELALGAVESVLLGNPVSHFALIIGLYMASMGLGAYLSGQVTRLEIRFVDSVVGTSLVGGASAPVLFVTFGLGGPFRLVLYTLTALVGVLVGIQLPILMRILRRREGFADVVAQALAFDYVGALAGSIAFSLLLMPWLGLVRTTVLLGLFNILSVLVVRRAFGPKLPGMRTRVVLSALAVGSLLVLWWGAVWIEDFTERV